MENKEVIDAIALVEGHLKLWGEAGAEKRLNMAKGIYAEQVKVVDPGGILNGIEEISDFIGDLLANNPGFEFRIVKPIEVHHHTALLSWQFGPASHPDQITGQDVFTLAEGLIVSLLVFVNGVTQTTLNN